MPVAPLAIIDVDAPSEPDKNWPGWGESGRSSLQGTDLVSVDMVSMVFAMSEGPCGGMADLERSIELDGIPILAADGTWNFEGITVAVTDGTADQYYIPGFDAIESEQSNGTPEVKFGTASIFNVTTSHANSARVKVSVPSFQKMDTGTGKGGVTSARIQISVSVDGGAYVVQELDENGWIKGYSSGPYVRGYKIALPDGAVRSIKVERLDAINTDTLVANKTYLQGWTEITDVKLRHPYVSLLALSFDAKLFGSIPVVTADWKGLLLRVPANYTPPFETAPGVWTPAVYATSGAGTTGGIWDGTFKTVDQWCSSPAWAFWTIATNKRYGCGKYLSDLDIDADALYEISKYCDELVTDGMGGSRPRFALNAYLTSDEESFKVLAHIISSARAQLYYSGGKMRPVQDVETDVVALFSPSNVKEGRFEYSGVAKRARHTMAKVSWWDPSQAFKIVPEPIQHLDGIAKYGVQTLETTAFGSTNMAQTRAWGNWALISEQTETEAISFTSGLEGLAVTIGDIIHVKDPSRDGVGMGGRLLGATTTVLTLDRPVILQAGLTYTAWVTLNDGTVVSRTVTTAAGTVSAVTVSPALASAPQAENQWQLADSTASPSRWRILSIKRPNSHEFEISALANNPAKYALADAIGSLVPTVPVPVVFSPISGLVVSSTSVYAQGQAVITVSAKWTQPVRAIGAIAQVSINGVWLDMPAVGSGASIQVPNAGTFPVRVAALYLGGRSSVVSGSVTATDVYSDGVLSRGAEKVQVKADWVTAQADYLTLGDKATALGISRTAFNAAYTALSDVSTRWSDATTDTVISDLSPALYTRWGTWGKECVAMQTAITAKAQTTLDNIANDSLLSDQERPALMDSIAALRAQWKTAYTDAVSRGVASSVTNAHRDETWKPAYQYFATLLYTIPNASAYDTEGSVVLGLPLAYTGAAVTLPAGYREFNNGIRNVITSLQGQTAAVPATAALAGVVKVGTGLSMAADGVTLNATGGSGSSTFATITGSPTDNANLSTALAAKANLTGATFTGPVAATTGTFSDTLTGNGLVLTSPAVTFKSGGTILGYVASSGNLIGSGTDLTAWATAGNGFKVYTDGYSTAPRLSIAANGAATFAAGISATTATFSSTVSTSSGYYIATGGTNVRISASDTSGSIGLNYNTGGTGSLYFYGGGTTHVFRVSDLGALTLQAGLTATTGTFSSTVQTSSNYYSSKNVSDSATFILNNPGALIGLGNYGSGNAKIAQCNSAGAWDASYPSTELYLGYANNKVYHAGNIEQSASALMAVQAYALAPQWVASLPALPDAKYPKSIYNAVTGRYDGGMVCIISTKEMYQNQNNAWVSVGSDYGIFGQVTAAQISAQSIGAGSLVSDLVMSTKIRTTGSAKGTATSAPNGVWIDGNPYTATCLNNADGSSRSLANCNMEIGGNVNFAGYPLSTLAVAKLVNGGIVSFPAAGTYYWTCPTGITQVELTLTAGGGSGSCNTLTLTYANGGGGGGSIRTMVTVTPGTTYTITIGDGGTAVVNGQGVAGGNSSAFGVTVYGGSGGGPGSLGGNGGAGGIQAGGVAVNGTTGTATQAVPGFSPVLSSGGASGGGITKAGGSCTGVAGGTGTPDGGGGGASAFGAGGTATATGGGAGQGAGAGGSGMNTFQVYPSGAGAGGSGMIRF